MFSLETSRLLLRDHTFEDWLAIHKYAKVPEFSQYDFWGPNSEEDTRFFVQNMVEQGKLQPRYKFDLAVVLKNSTQVIGGVGIRRESEKSSVGNMGYAVNPSYQKLGIASEAATAMLAFAFQKLNMKVVYATCDTRNVASYRVMEKIHMKRVGHLIRHKEYKGAWRDSYRYEICKEDFIPESLEK
jgi:RimJ/RimL family protein N-acetyltransferase